MIGRFGLGLAVWVMWDLLGPHLRGKVFNLGDNGVVLNGCYSVNSVWGWGILGCCGVGNVSQAPWRQSHHRFISLNSLSLSKCGMSPFDGGGLVEGDSVPEMAAVLLTELRIERDSSTAEAYGGVMLV
jgi:hypothetical protein